MQHYRINATIDPADLQTMIQGLADLRTSLSFMQQLTAEDRQRIVKMRDDRSSFVTKVVNYAAEYPHLYPSYLQGVQDVAQDKQLFDDLQRLLTSLEPLVEAVQDTKMIIGSQAFYTALSFYHNAVAAQQRDVIGSDTVVNDLKQLFEFATGPRPTSNNENTEDNTDNGDGSTRNDGSDDLSNLPDLPDLGNESPTGNGMS